MIQVAVQPVVKIFVFAVQEALVHLGDELLPEQRLLLGGELIVLRQLLLPIICSENRGMRGEWQNCTR